MELRKENYLEMVAEIGQEVEIELRLEELEIIIRDTPTGFALIDEKENESYYEVGYNLEELFEIINKNTVKKISYIDDDFNAMRVKTVYIKLINNEIFKLESL